MSDISDDIVVRIDVQTAEALAATNLYDKAMQRVAANLSLASKAQAKYDAAVATSGASSDKATAAQVRLGAALARTTEAEQRAAIAAAKSGEIQAAASAKAAAAADKAAAAQTAAAAKITASRKAQAGSLLQSTTGFSAQATGALALAAAFGYAVKSAADLDSKIATLQSLSAGTDVGPLKEAAFGYANIGISASSAADAEIELQKAGIGVNDQLGGALTGTLNLAAAGQMDVADATQIAAAAMTAFQLSGADIPHLADLLAAGADKALGSVSDLGEGLKYAALPAHQLGLSVDETVGALAEFAQAGLVGSQGGSSLQIMLQRLYKPTAEAQGIMNNLGISIYDAQGDFVGLASVAQQLHDKLGGLTLKQRQYDLAAIFSARAARAASILYQDGAAGVEDWAGKVNDAGFAAKQTSGKMDSLNGDLTKLVANLKNIAAQKGEGAQSPLRTLTQDLTGLVGIAGSSAMGKWLSVFGPTGLLSPIGWGQHVFDFGKGLFQDDPSDKIIPLWAGIDKAVGRATSGIAAAQSIAANSSRSMGGAMLDTADSVSTYKQVLQAAAFEADHLTKRQVKVQGIQFSDSDAGRVGALDTAIANLNSHTVSTADSVSALSSALDRLLGPNLNMVQATDAWTTGLRHLNDSLAKHNKTLMGSSDAAIQNRAAINGLVGNYTDMLEAGAGVNETSDQFNTRMKQQYTALINAGTAAGISRGDMQKYLATLGLTPKVVSTRIDLNADGAINKLDILLSRYNALKDKTVTVTANIREVSGFTPGGHTVYGNAAGDIVRGVGTGTSDSNLRAVSNGEAITRAAIVKREGENSFRALNAGRATIVPLRGFAGGGISGRSWGGSTTHTYTTDLAPLIAEVAALRQMLDQKGLSVRNPSVFDGRARGIARDEVTAQSRWASR